MDRSEAVMLYEKVVAALAGVERKGDTMPYTSLNGHMFSVVHKDGSVALRLPAVDREAFLKKYKTTLSSQYGIVQPEYVVVPDSLLVKTKELRRFFEISLAYVGSPEAKTDDQEEGPVIREAEVDVARAVVLRPDDTYVRADRMSSARLRHVEPCEPGPVRTRPDDSAELPAPDGHT